MEEYEYVATLGEGAYGHVWRCVQRSTGADVAVKGFKQAHELPEVMAMVIREVRVLRALDHPAIVRLLEAFRSKNGRVYMVFPYVGQSAHQLLDSYPEGLPAMQLKVLLWQVLQALVYLHAKKIVHRDIKPANILLGEGGSVKLCDFGFARGTHCGPRDAERLSSYVVTRWYRAPEVVAGDHYGPASDTWSLGCTLAELATGEAIFRGSSSADQLWRIMRCFGPLPLSLSRGCCCGESANGFLANRNGGGSSTSPHPISCWLSDRGAPRPDTATPCPCAAWHGAALAAPRTAAGGPLAAGMGRTTAVPAGLRRSSIDVALLKPRTAAEAAMRLQRQTQRHSAENLLPWLGSTGGGGGDGIAVGFGAAGFGAAAAAAVEPLADGSSVMLQPGRSVVDVAAMLATGGNSLERNAAVASHAAAAAAAASSKPGGSGGTVTASPFNSGGGSAVIGPQAASAAGPASASTAAAVTPGVGDSSLPRRPSHGTVARWHYPTARGLNAAVGLTPAAGKPQTVAALAGLAAAAAAAAGTGPASSRSLQLSGSLCRSSEFASGVDLLHTGKFDSLVFERWVGLPSAAAARSRAGPPAPPPGAAPPGGRVAAFAESLASRPRRPSAGSHRWAPELTSLGSLPCVHEASRAEDEMGIEVTAPGGLAAAAAAAAAQVAAAEAAAAATRAAGEDALPRRGTHVLSHLFSLAGESDGREGRLLAERGLCVLGSGDPGSHDGSTHVLQPYASHGGGPASPALALAAAATAAIAKLAPGHLQPQTARALLPVGSVRLAHAATEPPGAQGLSLDAAAPGVRVAAPAHAYSVPDPIGSALPLAAGVSMSGVTLMSEACTLSGASGTLTSVATGPGGGGGKSGSGAGTGGGGGVSSSRLLSVLPDAGGAATAFATSRTASRVTAGAARGMESPTPLSPGAAADQVIKRTTADDGKAKGAWHKFIKVIKAAFDKTA
ncbi:hypothetical protein HYH03_015810 [Edaphochlamys debaryana]|uniref:cyclin-dependent kinase n=1 Tax=Edaphochlamys debaryana TaxID=47281 RepID=A0A835XL53_9CHLO|nr:hypothetical protein HYH03_015810 [Edaphochlamys debaryana]|eukprot:KAG2485430.1 hypothetical protein HYH03_015810 [Edaphochlamys debaryana]